MPIRNEKEAEQKHKPQVTVSGNRVKVDVGSVMHPMTDSHGISWVYLETDKGGQMKNLEFKRKVDGCIFLLQHARIMENRY